MVVHILLLKASACKVRGERLCELKEGLGFSVSYAVGSGTRLGLPLLLTKVEDMDA
jgi:hypothetical protein